MLRLGSGWRKGFGNQPATWGKVLGNHNGRGPVDWAPAGVCTGNLYPGCLESAWQDQNLQCTANDVTLSEATNISIITRGSCVIEDGVRVCRCNLGQASHSRPIFGWI